MGGGSIIWRGSRESLQARLKDLLDVEGRWLRVWAMDHGDGIVEELSMTRWLGGQWGLDELMLQSVHFGRFNVPAEVFVIHIRFPEPE